VVEPNGMSLEHLLIPYIDYLTFGIHIAVGIVIGISVIIALVRIFRILLLNYRNKNEIPLSDLEVEDKHGTLRHAILFENVRMRLARGLLMALDFEVGSDILKTVIDPSFTELTILSVIVGIRIVLSWSLSKEISRQYEHLGRR
jgi:uncharacterized membrane protein